VPLQALRPKAWAEGQRAARDGIPATACPYKSTRGGFRNAWLGGHGTVTGVAVSGNHPRPVPALLKPKRPAEPPRLSPERRRGIEAGQGGESMSACPFGLNEQRQRDEWQAGWREGRQRRSCG
jgi:ribosome modulation factor